MKWIATLAILTLTNLAQAKPLAVKENQIAKKTDLVKIALATVNGKQVRVLTDAKGISVYTFDFDSKNVSVCKGVCLNEWPPVHVTATSKVAKPFGKIIGNDGLAQLTLNGLPLYHYDDDKKPGDVFGQYPHWDVITVLK